MLCSIYKSPKKENTYLYIKTKDDFSEVPEALLSTFGKPQFVMVLKLVEGRKLALADISKVRESLTTQGYYLQLPPPVTNLLDEYKANKSRNNT
ncbi:YcgL domain-containing protein [Photobacterium sp. GJ3]|uniref:YcgL domain-containing protein n=1 Tax=Photobacterium sp. GJ3 TaxID=2829502 RepID=UPI001B8A9C7B|nr:YcgL domain-containing protein [Photobacterium sp. GJ3]QUJ68398.1 YcgL domain-containing protein [Photobacterium sp. GJ3]